MARHRAAEEALDAAKARDAASTGSDDARRELDKLRRKIAELEKVQGAASGGADAKELVREKEQLELKLKDAQAAQAQAERAMNALQAEVDAAKTDALKARAEAARARAAADSSAEQVLQAASTPSGASNGELARAAQEIYETINDILSEMRNNMVLVKGELPNLSANADTMRAVADAVEALVDNAETAKGALRGLKELAQS